MRHLKAKGNYYFIGSYMVSKIFELEKKLAGQLVKLKEEFGLCAVKAEFEAEGASFRDLIKLRRLTAQQNVPLYLKIGGVEALRDIKDALDIDVDGLILPWWKARLEWSNLLEP